MDNEKQLLDLKERAESLAASKNATMALAELATIVADLIDIVHAKHHRNDDPGQE